MTDSPATRQSLLVRLKDPKDGLAWSEFVAIYTPLIDRLARCQGVSSGGCGRPGAGGFPGSGRGHRSL